MYLLVQSQQQRGRNNEICSKLLIKTHERPHLRRSGDFIVLFEHIPHAVLLFPLLTLNKQMTAGKAPFFFHAMHFPASTSIEKVFGSYRNSNS